MLVLSRKQAESICINDNVVVTVLSIRGSQVKIGIEAPLGTPVHRREVYEKIRGPDVARDVGGQRRLQAKTPRAAGGDNPRRSSGSS